MPPSREDRIAGGLLGLLVGDALGVPYEFTRPADVPPRQTIDFDPPPGFRRAHPGVPPGAWSDDGAQALCLLESLLERGELDLADFGDRLLAWRERGHMAVDGIVFDCGIQTDRAFAQMRSGVPAHAAGPSGERDNGNGSLMRVLPLALWHRGDDRELAELAAAQSRVTHGHRRAQLCCALYCLWARSVLDLEPRPWPSAVARLRALCRGDDVARAELDGPMLLGDAPAPTGSGYVVDCLHSARHVQREATFAGVVRAAVALGSDTDTTAAVAGGVAGIRFGLGGIPARWLEALRGRTLVWPLIERLLGAVSSS